MDTIVNTARDEIKKVDELRGSGNMGRG